MYHPGVGQAYLSKPTGDLESYTGDGDWFKIGSITSTSDGKNWVLDSTAASVKYFSHLLSQFLFGDILTVFGR